MTMPLVRATWFNRNQFSTDINRANLRNIKRCDERSDADCGTGNDSGGISHAVPGASAAPTAPKPKTAAVMINSLRRPIRSAKTPPIAAPTSDPSKTELTTISSILGEREKSLLMNRMAPEMTPMS